MPLILPSQRIARPNPLAYPAGAQPGFDPSHPAAKGMSDGNGFSAVASGNTFRALLSGQSFSVVGGGQTAGLSGTGQSVNYTGTDYNELSGQLGIAAPTAITYACILVPTSLAGAQTYISDVNSYFFGTNGANPQFFFNGNGHISTISLSLNVPYFFAASANSAGTVNYVVTNLLTGVVRSETVFNTAMVAALNSTQRISYNSNQANAKIFAAMGAFNVWLSPAQLVQWAADPWAFWYPNKTISLVSDTGVVAPTTQYAAFSIPQHDGQVYSQMMGY